MNFNATTGARQRKFGNHKEIAQGLGKKVKRVSDVNAIGPSIPTSQYMTPFDATQPSDFQQNQFSMSTSGQSQFTTSVPGSSNQFPESTSVGGGFNSATQQSQSYGYPQTQPVQNVNPPPYNQFQSYSLPPQQPIMPQGRPNADGGNFPPQFAMFQQPIVQDMAIQYGQKLADQGKQLVENQFDKYIPVNRLKYYFAVDNKYVINKICLLFFPFTHRDWSLKYDQENPVQPRFDINAADLYIPSMAYITYVVLAGLMLGMQNRFTPEQLGIQASSALAYSMFELVVYSITLYVANIPTNLKTLDLLAFSGYKYAIINACILVSILFQKSGYYIGLMYCSLSLSFFLLRTLKTKILSESAQTSTAGGITYDAYGAPQTQQFSYSVGRKRKLYFLFLIVGCQVFLSFWLSKHLILS